MYKDKPNELSSELLPAFKDRALETEYRDSLLASKRGLIRIGLVLAALLFAIIEPVGRLIVPSAIPNLDFVARWFIHIPIILATLAVLEFSTSHTRVERCLTFCLATILLSNAMLLWFAGGADRLFYAIASIQIMLFGFLLLGLRFKVAFLCILACFGLTATAAFILDISLYAGDILGNAYVTPLLVFFGLAFSSYGLDASTRAAFLANRARNKEYAQRLAMESERRRWLQLGSDYLNHEIKNAVLGITSSLNLLKRRNSNQSLDNYIDRAENSAQFMKRLLSELSVSTSLDSALENIVLERIDLSDLVALKAKDYQDMYPDSYFSVSVPRSIQVDGDSDRIVQVMDKLIDNAVAHSDGAQPITIRLAESGQTAALTIVNFGDLLVDQEEEIFEPFVSRREQSYDTGFGFGLYIVRRIAEAHGGTVSAHGLTNPDGAEFRVRLPLAAAATR